MNILVIDAQGGGLGRQVIMAVRKTFPDIEITAVGTNAIASSGMLKAGAHHVATGENAVITCCRRADYIVGPVGMVIADSLYGEITPRMAVAVGQSSGIKVLIPMNRCDNLVLGTAGRTVDDMIAELLECLEKAAASGREV